MISDFLVVYLAVGHIKNYSVTSKYEDDVIFFPHFYIARYILPNARYPISNTVQYVLCI